MNEKLLKCITSSEFKKRLNMGDVKPEISLYAEGEYNKNFLFYTDEKEALLRINYGSQMHLENQIKYEYDALKLLENTNRTPKVYMYSEDLYEKPFLVMEFLGGSHLDYKKNLLGAAEALADIHSTPVTNHHLISANDGPLMMIKECEELFKKYLDSNEDAQKKSYIKSLIEKIKEKSKLLVDEDIRCIINTELNNQNFLVENDFVRVVDWEKPIYGDPAQDLGHFLAPTTTFWKTDIILSKNDFINFIDKYKKSVDKRINLGDIYRRTQIYAMLNCLRGITWVSHAYIEYKSKSKSVMHETTKKKLDAYLDYSFLEKINQYITEVI